MDLDALRLFVDLAETGSFSKTAQRNYISQSAVSQRVRGLEQELGHRLVERGKGRPGAHFTEAGERALQHAREILTSAEALRQELSHLSDDVAGPLNVATVYSIGLHALTPALRTYLSTFPQVNLHLEYLRTDRIYDALLTGAIDCGIVACPRERPGVDVVPLGTEAMVAIAAPSHPLGQQSSLTLAQLEGVAFVAFEADIPTRRLIDSFLESHGVSVRITQTFDNIETIKRVVELGLGVALVPEPTVGRELRDGTLRAFPLAETPLTRPTGILLRKGRSPSRALARFLAVLQTDAIPVPPSV